MVSGDVYTVRVWWYTVGRDGGGGAAYSLAAEEPERLREPDREDERREEPEREEREELEEERVEEDGAP